MQRIADIAGAVLMTLLLTGIAASQSPSAEFERRAREMRAEHQRRVDEMRARHDRRVAESNAEFQRRPGETAQTWSDRVSRQMKARHERMKADFEARIESGNFRRNPLAPQPTPAPFDSDTAPAPADCLKAFIAAAAKAESLKELYDYMPRDQRPRFNDSFIGETWASSNTADDQANRFTLKHRKAFAESILDVLSVEIDGDQAVVMVSTNSGGISHGVEYPYGKARIEMVGENKYWKVQTYKDTFLKFMDRPQPER